jgi:hypothetical protein
MQQEVANTCGAPPARFEALVETQQKRAQAATHGCYGASIPAVVVAREGKKERLAARKGN